MADIGELQIIKGIGPVLADKFAAIGIDSVDDLLLYTPRKYVDYHKLSNIADMQPGLVTLRVKFEKISSKRVRRGLHITQAQAVDDNGRVNVVWFNQPYRAKSITSSNYFLQGEFGLSNKRLQITNPSIELASDVNGVSAIIPAYSERGGLKSRQIQKAINQVFATGYNIEPCVPKNLGEIYNLMDLNVAIYEIHNPKNAKNLESAKKRLAFEELFVVMLAAGELKKANKSVPAKPVEFKKQAAQQFVSSLPFDLTDDQRRVVWQIYKDVQHTEPMNRLVEGDVGSGKTVVAAMAALMVLESKMQVALLAPTELLARQHYQTFSKVFSHTNHVKNLELLVGSLPAKEKSLANQRITNGQSSCVIGTHALLQHGVKWSNLGLVIIDEQHRFGVKQRQSLQTKSGYMPHILNMTATPIPRSLALTVYGELDISIISQAPSAKAGVDTKLISPNSTAQMYDSIKEQLNYGRQGYIVCPLITESEFLNFASAEQTYKELTQKELKDYKVGLLHGGLPANQKETVMQQFKDGKLDAVVATTVIEVGVDVPNATEMVIMGADRFGLAQLHQLRGRVGRGEHKGTCYLVMSDSAKPSRRMQAIASTNNGFELAEYDLELRGPGAIYGTRQHGELDLRFVSLTDHVLIAEVRQAVNQFISSGLSVVKYPRLNKQVKRALKLTYLN